MTPRDTETLARIIGTLGDAWHVRYSMRVAYERRQRAAGIAWPSALPAYLERVRLADLAAAMLRSGEWSPREAWRGVLELGRRLDNPHEPYHRCGYRLAMMAQEQLGRVSS